MVAWFLWSVAWFLWSVARILWSALHCTAPHRRTQATDHRNRATDHRNRATIKPVPRTPNYCQFWIQRCMWPENMWEERIFLYAGPQHFTIIRENSAK